MNSYRFRKGLIIHPGAIGDCLLALPLASFLKQVLKLDQVDWIGRTEYIEFYPGRTAVDRIRSMESIPFHRLFEEVREFEVEDGDPLVQYFSGYEQVISFLGAKNPNFEQNLLYTIHCSQSAHVTMLSADEESYTEHISKYYLETTALENEMPLIEWYPSQRLIEPHPNDYSTGREILDDLDIDPDLSIILIHPGSGGTHKCWAMENFFRLADEIQQSNYKVIFLLGPAEKERMEKAVFQRMETYSVLSELSLTQVLQVLSCTDGYIGNDSGITHLASVTGKPTIAVFGPTNPDKFAPIGPKVKILKIDPAVFQKSSEADVFRTWELLQEIL